MTLSEILLTLLELALGAFLIAAIIIAVTLS